jgi:L-iditol 2-dehydrogenase
VRRMEVQEVPRRDPGPRDAVVLVTAVGLCGTDFHIFDGHGNYHMDRQGRPVPLTESPQILGHEIAGVVEEVGRAVDDLRPGDDVVVDQGLNCVSVGRAPLCEFCATGDSHQCEQYEEHGITGLPGGLAEFLVVPAVNCVKTGRALAAADAALVEPLACILHTMHAAERAAGRYRLNGLAGTSRPASVLVAGAGPAGLLFVQYLRRVLGYDGRLLVSEPMPARRALAARYGADTTLDPRTEPVVDRVLDETDGRRVDWLIDASGAASVFADMPGLIRKQATVVLYAHGQSGADLGLLNNVQFREPTLVATVGASGGFDADGRPTVYRRAMELIAGGTIDVSQFVTDRYTSLDAIPDAFGGPARRQPGYVKGAYLRPTGE